MRKVEGLKRIALVFIGVICGGVVLEVGTRFLWTTPDGFGVTLPSKRWETSYWQPVNSHGFRDVEHSDTEMKSKKRLFVVGDSFVAGSGIENVRDRFANIIGRELGSEWVVVNFAQRGWNTAEELDALRGSRWKPDALVLSYYINDIEGAAGTHEVFFSYDALRPAKWLEPLLAQSAVLNAAYWYGYVRLVKVGDSYWEYLKRCFDDHDIWETHAAELRDLVAYARDNRIKIVAIVFNDLHHGEEFRRYTARVVEVLESEAVPTVDAAWYFADQQWQELVVSRFDSHPNAATHAIAAQLLLERLRPELATN